MQDRGCAKAEGAALHRQGTQDCTDKRGCTAQARDWFQACRFSRDLARMQDPVQPVRCPNCLPVHPCARGPDAQPGIAPGACIGWVSMLTIACRGVCVCVCVCVPVWMCLSMHASPQRASVIVRFCVEFV